MSNKIAIIITAPHHKSIIEQVIKENEYHIDVHQDASVDKCFSIAEQCVHRGTKAIIAPAPVAEMIKNQLDVVTFPIYRSPFSFVSKLHEILKKEEKVAVFIRVYDTPYRNATSNYRNAALQAASIFPDRTVIEPVNENSDFDAIGLRLLSQKITAIVSPTWVFPYLQGYDFDKYAFPLAKSDVEAVIHEAQHHIQTIEAAERNANLLNTVFNKTPNGVIAFNAARNILYINQRACKYLQISQEVPCQEKENTLYQALRVDEVFQTGAQISGYFTEYGKTAYIATAEPVVVDGVVAIAVVTLDSVEAVRANEQKIRQNLHGKGNFASKTFSSIVGNSPAMQRAIWEAKRYATVDSTVLISAPTGCGKEIFAQSIHNESLRRSKPFVVINCAAMPESILESILFGYVKGAFTGAHTEGKAGLFEVAHGGTIFIDEISELPYSLQSRFLRVLQEREVMRIGSDHAISIDVRIIAATNRNLLEMVQKGVFRADLYFRLSILPLKLPPLDSRISDVPDLARFFVTQKSTELGITPKSITPEAMNHLMQLHYPGNVRQLSNMIERAIVTSNGKSITLNDIADAFEESILPVETSKVPFSPDSEKTLPIQKIAGYPKTSRQLTAQDIQDALAQNLNSNTAAAAELGISTATLWRKRKKFGLL